MDTPKYGSEMIDMLDEERKRSTLPSNVQAPQRRFFSSQMRVRKRSEFRRIQASSLRVRTPHFVFLLSHNQQSSGPRLGITASRKVGCAVVRNRAKRVLREVFRLKPNRWPESVDVVVIVRYWEDRLGLAEVRSEWEAAMPRFESTVERLTTKSTV